MFVPLNLRKKLTDIYKSGPVGQRIVTAFCAIYIQGQKALNVKPYMDINPLAIAVHKYKFLFIGVPKVATQTFLNSFYFDKEVRRAYDVELIEKNPTAHTAYALYPDYFSFSLVRNPWARALSCYNSKIFNPDPVKRARTLSLYKGLEPGMSFVDFTRWLLTDEGCDDIADRHWLSQYHFLVNEKGDMCCKQIGRFENMSNDVESVFQDIGMSEIDLKTRAFVSGASAYQDAYCDESRENISKRYAKDIEILNYTF